MQAATMRESAAAIVRTLQAAGYEAGWVGGCVRDQLLGKAPKDYDIATSARPEAVEQLFPRTVPVGRQFGVVLVLDCDGSFQVATFRAEADYRDGRRPGRVEFAGAEADARRRDFTVNGLFYDPIADRLFDWVGGEADLRARRLRTIGDPAERFGEDHLRLLRGVRFAAQLQFDIEPDTWTALRTNAHKIRGVSAERIREELLRLFEPPHAARGLDLLRDSGLLREVLPEVEALAACEQSPDFHPEGTVFNHVRRMLDLLPTGSSPELAWAVLCHDLAKPVTASRDPATGAIHFYGHERIGAEMTEVILGRLRFPRAFIEAVVTAVRYHMQFKDVRQMRRATLRRMMLRPTFDLELALHRLDCLGCHGGLDSYEFLVAERADWERQPALHPPLVTGADLLAEGWRPGPALGAMLESIRDRQLQGELTTREAALAWAQAARNARPPRTGEPPAADGTPPAP